MELDRRIRYEATRHLRQTDNIRRGLEWIRHHPEGFSQRVIELETTVETLNTLILGRDIDLLRYGNIAALKKFFIDGEPINQPSDFTTMYDDWKEFDDYEETGTFLESFFPRIHSIISTQQWEFPTAIIDNPNKLASGLLIEGYGQLLEDFYQKPGLSRKFVLGFEEVLISQSPDSTLLSDVLDWMTEEKEDFSPAIRIDIDELSTKPQTEFEQSARRINRIFRQGGFAYDVIDDIRRFPRPIAVDFNNVIANNFPPLTLNPEAPAFLQELRQIGNVFIVTSASYWDGIRNFLYEHGLWSSDIVLMTAPTYEFVSPRQTWHPRGKTLRKEFLEMAKKLEWNFNEDDLITQHKAVAPIFGKPFAVPIIDDSYGVTHNNPGMLGIEVQAWESDLRFQQDYASSNAGKPTLTEAIEIVRNHYATLDPVK